MKREQALNFFDISSNIKDLPKNELLTLKGGYSDIAWWDEIDNVDVYPPDDSDPWGSNDDGDPWGGNDPWDDDSYDEEYWGSGGGNSGDNNSSSNNSSSDLPDELCFTALFSQYPDSNLDGTPAHPSNDSYAVNQCAIRVGEMFINSYDVDFAASDNYTGNVTSEGYPRGAKDVADWLKKEGIGYHEMSLSEFMNSQYYHQTGIIYQVAQSNSMAHIDIYSGAGNTGSGFYNNDKIIFFPIEDNGC